MNDNNLNNSNNLKPVRCGCGGEGEVHIMGHELTKAQYYINCEKCDTRTWFYDTESEAIEAWNKAMGAELRSNCEALRSCAAPWEPDRNRYCCEICGHYVGKYDAYCGGCGAKLTDYTPDGRGKQK